MAGAMAKFKSGNRQYVILLVPKLELVSEKGMRDKMKSAIKSIIILLFVIGLLSVLVLVAYDISCFQPRIAEIKSLITSAADEEKNLSVTTMKLLKIEFNGKESVYVSKLVMYQLKLAPELRSNFYRHLISMIWSNLIRFHLSEQEQNIIIAAYSPMGNNIVGFFAAAEARFNKNLASLSPQESATIVALTRAPGAYTASADRLNQRRDFLLKELSNYYPGE